MTQATERDYWISPNAFYIELNAMGLPDYIQASCVSGAKILVYIKDIISYDAGHNYKRWTLQASPTVFNTHTAKYVYAAVPRSDDGTKNAFIVFPSEELDVYGKNVAGQQIGSEEYYYVFLQGIITSSGDNGTENRDWQQRVSSGLLASDEAISATGTETEWYKYSSVDGIVTFLKNLTMKVGTLFRNLFVETLTIVSGGKIAFENQGEIEGIADNSTSVSSTNRIVTPKFLDDNTLSSVSDDTAQGLITFAKGLISEMLAQLKGGATFGKSGYKFDKDGNVVVDALSSLTFDEALERGFGITKNTQGKYTLSVTDLMVWGKAVFNSLEIRKLYAVGGNVYLSGASSKLQHVSPVTDADGEVTGWKCYILGDDGTTATQNGWVRYDQAKCQTFDIKEGVYENVSNTYYWRLVTDVSTENETITETYTDADGKEQTRDLYDGKKFGWVILSKTDCESAANDAPKAGDTIVLDGHRMFASGDAEGRDQYNDESRTNVMMLETTGVSDGSLPRIVALTGITDYRHSDGKNEYSNTVFILSPKEVIFVSSCIKWISASGDPITLVNFRGNWAEGTKYAYYDQVSHDNAIWTCIVEKGTTTTDEPSDTSAAWRKEISGGTSHGVTLTMEKRTISSVEDDCLVVTFTKGDTDGVTTTNNVQDIGGYAQLYVDGKIDTSATARLNLGTSEAGELQKGAFPQVFTAGYVTVKWYDKEGTLLGMGSLTRGADGKDATVYGVQVSSYSEWISSGNKQQGLQFGFTKTTGTTVEKYTNVTKMGCTVKIYGDDTLYDNVSGWINEGNDNFLFSSFPYNNVVGNPTLADKSVISVELYHDDVLLATANYANGKQGADGKGALEIICDPETIVIDTDDNGLVKDTDADGQVTGNYDAFRATLMCVRDGKEVDNVTYNIGSTVNCEAKVNNVGVVTITKVNTQPVTIGGNTVTVSCTSGSVTVSVYDPTTKTTYAKTVPFAVNVAKFNGGLKADNKTLRSQYSELSKNSATKDDLKQYDSKIEQTARNISLKVMEKSVGRRNLLPGSAFRKQGEGCSVVQEGQDAINGICINGGYDGTNCVRLRNESPNAYPRISWDGARNSNVKVEKGRKYTLSFWAKRLSSQESGYEISTQFLLQDGANGYDRPYGPLKFGSFTVKSQGEWEFIQDTVTIPSDAKANYIEVCICLGLYQSGMAEILVCRPMLEEGDEYNGWTLSEQDYDYVGGNLLDNAGTLTKTGNVEVLDGTVTQGGMGESASIKAELPPTVKEVDFLQYSTSGMGLKANEDYTLSFYAKTEDNAGKLQCYLYPSDGGINTEDSESGYDNSWYPSDGDLRSEIVPGTRWKRYWVHWRPTKADPKHVLFRLSRGGNDRGTYSSYTTYAVDDVVLYDGTYYRCIKAGQGNTPSSSSSYWDATRYQISLSQPKLEVGATVTEWTAKRSDMVDKQALYATGIDIDSKTIILTADHTYVRTNDGTPTVMIDADGNLANVKVNADMVNVSAAHKLSISGNGSMVVDMDNFKLDESGNASFKGSIDSKSGTISFFTFTDSGMYSATSSLSLWGLGLRSTNISVRGNPGGRTSLVCLGDGRRDTTGGDNNTYPTSVVNGQDVNYCNLIQVKGGGNGNGRDAAALGIETEGDYCLSAMGGLSHLQGLALDASTTSGSANRTLFLCSGGSFTMPSNPKDGQLVIVIQTTSSGITFYGGGKSFRKGASTSSTANSGSAGQWNFFVYDDSVSCWRCVYANGGLF